MIVQCRKCATRFRFDEALLGTEGAWLRCSRCAEIFFQTSPADKREAVTEELSQELALQDKEKRPEEEGVDEITCGGDMDAQKADETEREARAFPTEIDRSLELSGSEGLMADSPKQMTKNKEGEEETKIDEDLPWPAAPPKAKRRTLARGLAYFGLVLVIIASAAFSLFQLYPKESQEAIDNLLLQAPELSRMLGLESRMKATDHSVKFVDLQQRFIHNVILGSLRIVEGKITNTGPYPLARLKVRGELRDAQGVVIGERVVFCGNIISDEDLMNLTEEEIIKITNRPEGQGFANDRLVSGAQIPFMLIFARENAGAVKTMLYFAGAERVFE